MTMFPRSIAVAKIRRGWPCAVTALPVGPDGRLSPNEGTRPRRPARNCGFPVVLPMGETFDAAVVEDGQLNLWLTAVIVLGSTAAGVGLFMLHRRHAPEGGYFSDGDRAAGVFGVLTTGFAILLGFIIYLAFLSDDTARSGARQESTLDPALPGRATAPRAGCDQAFEPAGLLRAGSRRCRVAPAPGRSQAALQPLGDPTLRGVQARFSRRHRRSRTARIPSGST